MSNKRIAWRKQPPPSVELDEAHPFTRYVAGYWPLSDRWPRDYSKNANHGTYGFNNGGGGFTSGDPNWEADHAGMVARNFNGSTEYISIGDPANLRFGGTQDYMQWAWFKTTASGLGTVPVFQDYWGNYALSGLSVLTDGTANFAYRDLADIATQINSSPVTVNDGKWHMMLGVIDRTNTKMRFYLDGKFVNEATPTVHANGNSATTVNWWNIGGSNNPASPTCDTSMAISNCAVVLKLPTAAEVYSLYERQWQMFTPHRRRRSVFDVSAPAIAVDDTILLGQICL